MSRRFRVIDTGLREGRANIAFDQALIDARKNGLIPDTVRFLRFHPSALVGVHQVLGHEVRLDHCRRKGIQVGRRITGGGGLYLDEGQIGWELVFDRASLGISDLTNLTRQICEAAALGLRKLGVDAQYRPRNDIEVEGRKICGTGGIFDGNTLFFQGTLLIDFDPADMIEALKVPVEKLAKRDLDSARQRVVTLRQLLGDDLPDLPAIYQALLDGFAQGLGIEPAWGEITPEEERLAVEIHDEEIGTDDYVAMLDAPEADDSLVTASLTRRGGTLRADVRLEGAQRERIREVLITGDFFVTPPRLIFDLEAALRGLHRADAPAAVDAFFAAHEADFVNLGPDDFREVVAAALRQLSFPISGGNLRGHFIGPSPGSETSSGPTLLFLHDALGSVRLWRDVPHRLAEKTGLGALVFDRLGSGDSDPIAPPFNRRYLHEEALETLPRVMEMAGVRDALLIGHSDGAAIALAYAGAYPEKVKGVVALSPHLFSEERTLDAIAGQIEDFENGDLKARLARYHGSRTETLFARLVEAWTGDGPTDWGLDDYVARVRCPVLGLQGADDEFFSSAQLDHLAVLLAGRLQQAVIPDCGHYPHREARRTTLQALERFVRDAVMQGLNAPAPGAAVSNNQNDLRISE